MAKTDPAPPALDTTPGARLREGALGGILGYGLAQATVATAAVFEAQVGGPLGLRPVEYTLLALVHENPDVSATQLARALAVTAPNIKMWVDRLEARGLVQRVRSTQDRRAQHLRTTREGRAQVQRCSQLLHEGEAQALQRLTPGERAILLELLHKVAQRR